jgi:alanine dehydrogenase
VKIAVANMPGAVALTSTLALTNQTLMYGLEIADAGIAKAVRANPALRQGLNLYRGRVTHRAVADSLNLPFVDADAALETVG